MIFLLNSQNVLDYVIEHNICKKEDTISESIVQINAKNFNLLLTLKNERKLLIKQERIKNEKTISEFSIEWQNHQLFHEFPNLNFIKCFLSKYLYFDANNSIIVFDYLDNYLDLSKFYIEENIFPVNVAKTIGKLIGTIHQATFKRHEYRDFLIRKQQYSEHNPAFIMARDLENIKPEVFGMYPRNGIKFLELYQRYDSLAKAITELSETFQPSCLTHNDLKLNNILLHKDWDSIIYQTEPIEDSIVRLIDWERGNWGDPAFDLGTIIASYVQLWLNSLVVSKDISITQTLHLAKIPLDLLQPSISGVVEGYLAKFPEILQYSPDFFQRIVQFAGLNLIQKIQAMIQYQKSFGNIGIFTLQVAKSLLCQPEKSMTTIFGDLSRQLFYSVSSL